MPDRDGNVADDTNLLLTHRAGRLEDLANNSIELIKINLLVLGLFTPVASSLEGGLSELGGVVTSNYGIGGLATWATGMLFSMYVFKQTRSGSIEQFSPLEDAIVNDHSQQTLKKDIADGKVEYENRTENLVAVVSVAIGLSLSSILLLIFAVAAAGDSNFLNQGYGFAIVGITYVIITGRGNIVAVKALITSLRDKANQVKQFNRSTQESVTRQLSSTNISRYEQIVEHISSEGESVRVEKPSAGGTEGEDLESDEIQAIRDIARALNSTSEIPITRGTLLVAIDRIFGTKPFKLSDLQSKLEETEIPVTRTLLNRLMEDGLLEEDSTGPQYYIVNTRKDEIIVDEPIEEANSELRNLLSFIDEQYSTGTFTNRHIVESALNQDDLAKKIEVLDSQLDMLEESGANLDSVGRIKFVRAAMKYKITERSKEAITQAEYELESGEYPREDRDLSASE